MLPRIRKNFPRGKILADLLVTVFQYSRPKTRPEIGQVAGAFFSRQNVLQQRPTKISINNGATRFA
jgi:hypothetical protein